MPFVEIGDLTIPYQVRRSRRARRIRITVRPQRVEIVAPLFTRAGRIRAFVESNGRWIVDRLKAVGERELLAAPARFVSGARVRFRGRSLQLRVTEAAEPTARCLRFRNAFHVTVEAGLEEDEREQAVRDLVMRWLKERALGNAEDWSRSYGAELGVRPAKIRIGDQKTLWGSCSARGVLSLNWRLIAAPKRVFEYVVVHELCHLKERNHGPRFWSLVEEHMPDYRERRAWLKRRSVGLG